MIQLVQGALYPAVRSKDVRGFEAPFAPLNEQKRIADKLDVVLARVDACRDRLDRIPATLKRFRQSVLAAATSGALTEDWRIDKSKEVQDPIDMGELLTLRNSKINNRGKFKPPILANEVESSEFIELPESWYRATLDQIVWSVKDGPHFSPKYVESGIPFISGGSIRPEGIDFSIAKFITPELHAELSGRCKPELHDILYTKGGTTGIARVNTETREFNVWVHVAVLKLVSIAITNPFFIQHVLNSPQGYIQSRRYTHGVGNQDLGLTRMIKTVIPLPPPDEQTEIVRRVESLFAYADRLEAYYATARGQVDKLTLALLAKAFRGELVPQDPNDEPASELLARIIAAKPIQTKKKATRKSS
jgi:type I restriction enzyme S subunit